MKQLLVIDDDTALCELVTEYLEPHGYKVDAVYDGATGVRRALSGEHALAVLDYVLPGMNGFEVLCHIRARSRLPIVLLTAPSEDINGITGLQIGADDFLAKPFNPLELLARINAIIRRTQIDLKPQQERDLLIIGDIEIDSRTRTVRRAGEVVELTLVEYSLLKKLLSAPGRIFEREGIVREVLHRDLSPLDRSLDTHLSNLRRKLGHRVNGVERIKTVRGVGYIYASPEAVRSFHGENIPMVEAQSGPKSASNNGA
jgi:two-component system, OmpR family, response regulator CpxR